MGLLIPVHLMTWLECCLRSHIEAETRAATLKMSADDVEVNQVIPGARSVAWRRAVSLSLPSQDQLMSHRRTSKNHAKSTRDEAQKHGRLTPASLALTRPLLTFHPHQRPHNYPAPTQLTLLPHIYTNQ